MTATQPAPRREPNWICDICGSDNSAPGAGIINHANIRWCMPCHARAGGDRGVREDASEIEKRVAIIAKAERVRLWREWLAAGQVRP